MSIPEPEERFYSLCALIAAEKDPQKFLILVRELNEVLDKRDKTELITTIS